jgi:hypothetical protein
MQVCNTKLAECAAEEKERCEAKEDLASDRNQRGTAFVQAFAVLRMQTYLFEHNTYGETTDTLVDATEDLCVNYQLIPC